MAKLYTLSWLLTAGLLLVGFVGMWRDAIVFREVIRRRFQEFDGLGAGIRTENLSVTRNN